MVGEPIFKDKEKQEMKTMRTPSGKQPFSTKATVLGLALLAAGVLSAGDLYVNVANAGKSGLDGSSPELAFATIQEGVDAAAEGDTVHVAAGTYSEGGASNFVNIGTDRDSYGAARVNITNAITLISDEGAANTVILGAWDPSSTVNVGLGDAAIRCVRVSDVSAVVKGFTLRNGASTYTLTGTTVVDYDCNRGGGVLATACTSSTLAYSTKPLFVDCVIENCSAGRGGGASGGSFVRCVFRNNWCSEGANDLRGANAYFCTMSGANCAKAKTSSYASSVFHGTCVNCTFLGVGYVVQGGPTMRNCLSIGTVKGIVSGTFTGTMKNCSLDIDMTGDEKYTNCIYDPDAQLLGGACGNNFSLVSPVQAVTRAGSEEFLSLVPAGYRDLDIDGNAVSTGEGIVAGAAQRVYAVAPAGAMTIEKPSNGTMSVDGAEVARSGLIYTTNAYVTLSFKPASGYEFVCCSFIRGERFYPDASGNVQFSIPQSTNQTLRAKFSQPVYVSDGRGADGTADGKISHPYKTIQAAVDASADASLILVEPGDYNIGSSNACDLATRVVIDKEIYLRSTGGAANTFISGASDSASTDGSGLGPNAVRCLAFTKLVAGCVQGFTLRNGRTAATRSGKEGRGGAVTTTYGSISLFKNQHIVDCVIDNCSGFEGGTAMYGTFKRCVFRNCVNTNAGVDPLYGCWLFACLFENNSSVGNSRALVGNITRSLNCTYVSNDFAYAVSKIGDEYAINAVIYGTSGKDVKTSDAALTNSLYLTGTGPADSGDVQDYPYFANYAAGDYRLTVDSQGVGLGATDYLMGGELNSLNPTTWAFCDLTGINGVPLISKSGSMVAGAYGGIAPAPATTVWYVGGAGASDSNDGKTAATAFATIQAGVDAATGLEENGGYAEIVRVAPGTYATGSRLSGKPDKVDPTLLARVVCEKNINIVATSSDPADTVIQGASDTTEFADVYGNGTNAVRCVYMTAGRLEGFTLRGGRTWLYVSGGASVNDQAGGIWGGNEKGGVTVANCVIDDCSAPRGGGVYGGSYINCWFKDCSCTSSGSAVRYAKLLYQCLVTGSKGEIILAGCPQIVGCSIVNTNSTRSAINNCLDVRNTIVTYGRIEAPYDDTTLASCALGVDVTFLGSNGHSVYSNDCVVGELEFDSSFRPIVGSSVAVDAGASALLPEDYPAETDFGGGPRIINGTIDVGCYEADWRRRYAEDIGRRFAISEVSVAAVEENGKVLLKDGTLTGTWTWPDSLGTLVMNVSVTGSGTLTVMREGVVVATVLSGDGSVAIPASYSGFAADEWTFSYAPGVGDTGGALLAAAGWSHGLMLLIR